MVSLSYSLVCLSLRHRRRRLSVRRRQRPVISRVREYLNTREVLCECMVQYDLALPLDCDFGPRPIHIALYTTLSPLHPMSEATSEHSALMWACAFIWLGRPYISWIASFLFIFLFYSFINFYCFTLLLTSDFLYSFVHDLLKVRFRLILD